jgi:hypothetical protein
MTQQVYISDTNIWIDFRNAGLLDALFSLPFKLCCTDFVLDELQDVDTKHLLVRGLVVETLDAAATAALFNLMQAQTDGLKVHGALWLLDQLVEHQTIKTKEAAKGLQSMRDAGPRLPNAECRQRRSLWML